MPRHHRRPNAAALRVLGWRCYYCGDGKSRLSDDHFKPKSKGGTYHHSNIVPACNICNGIKGSRTIEASRSAIVQKILGWPRFNRTQIDWLRAQGFDMTKYDTTPMAFEAAIARLKQTDCRTENNETTAGAGQARCVPSRGASTRGTEP